ncbi:LacI family DNA-binding transcriptional regulator [Allorhizocola rhizosphaerae]|uniref:LacI family DNA-binding transcriptional regulator n=1 Tax=Allorhizocola rhizosphaerae TaxID=1872709 RepID=UPI000E3E1B5C|nr:LacI family DNA-binding transcriptional regulator [Allorhizocola rhizosphaerae]
MAEANNIKEVARRAGVSLGTVSNVLNRPETVTPAIRQRVLDVIKEVGYVRNDSARHLRAGRSRTVAIVVLDVANPFFTDIVRGAEQVVERAGGMLVVCNSGEDLAREQRHLDALEEQRVRGLLITPVGRSSKRVERLVKRGIPVVLVDRGSGEANRCSVAVDDVMGGRLAADHLAKAGHRRIAFVGGPFTITQVTDRHAGATQALADRDGDIDLQVIETRSLSANAGRGAAESICALPTAKRPTAVFCANDLLALGVLQGLTTGGLRVPQDVALIGYDDIDYAASAAVPLTSVRQPREQLGRTAAQLLLEEADDADRHGHRHVVFEPQLIVRQSTSTVRRKGR